MAHQQNLPETVLSIIVQEIDEAVSLLGVCAGHEEKKWRYDALSLDMLNWAADWVLTHEERASFTLSNGMALMAKAISLIYTSEKYKNRGEIGELLLHMVLRRFLNSEQAISRIYFKDAPNDTVKGFDAVHIVETSEAGENGSELELWLGESKFFTDGSGAIRAVLAELQDHLDKQYLRTEFAAISSKIDPSWKHAETLKSLLARQVSLDEVFERVVIPVFITFDSDITGKHQTSSPEYKAEIAEHLRAEWETFRQKLTAKQLPREVRVQLILLPMNTKTDLLDAFDGRLKSWQAAFQP